MDEHFRRQGGDNVSWKLVHRDGEVYDAGFSPLTRNDLIHLKKSDGWSRGIDWGIYLQPNQPFSA